MKIFGLEITWASVRKATADALSPAFGSGGWFPLIIREGFTGAWQKDIGLSYQTVLCNPILFACTTLIAGDISKMGIALKQKDSNGIWNETTNAAYDPVLRDPNDYQNWAQFMEVWMLSKLTRGNTYVLKVRDNRGVVTDLYVLHPDRCRPMITVEGDKFYEVQPDNVSGITEAVTVPASEIIHDRWNCLFHPLVGLSPIYACWVAAKQGIEIQNSSAHFFANRSMPGGVLTAPGAISKETAERLKEHWTENFQGANAGKIAVAGDGLTYQTLSVSAVDSQLIDQLKWTGETICAVFHVPLYMVGVGNIPNNANIQAANLQYFSQALHRHIEEIEYAFDDGLSFSKDLGIFFDVENLLRMDSLTLIQSLGEGVKAGLVAPNEGRKKLNYPPVEGGESPYLQQQNYSLADLAKRSQLPNPFQTAPSLPAPAPPDQPADGPNNSDSATAKALEAFVKGLAA